MDRKTARNTYQQTPKPLRPPDIYYLGTKSSAEEESSLSNKSLGFADSS
jgi:hypothetical protein